MAGTIRIPIPRDATSGQAEEIRRCFAEVPLEDVLAGLRFARNRWEAKDAGTLRVGRRSIVAREVHAVTPEQARWRLKNWKMMIANYRAHGYSYPTISRIKKILAQRGREEDVPPETKTSI